jgi:hypothetical protein
VKGQGLVVMVSWILSRAASGSTTGSRTGSAQRFWLCEAVLRLLWWCRGLVGGRLTEPPLRFARCVSVRRPTSGLPLIHGPGGSRAHWDGDEWGRGSTEGTKKLHER